MIKFFKKYKYTSLVVGALVVALVSGVSWGFVCKQNIAKKQIRRFQGVIPQLPKNASEGLKTAAKQFSYEDTERLFP